MRCYTKPSPKEFFGNAIESPAGVWDRVAQGCKRSCTKSEREFCKERPTKSYRIL